MGYSCCAGKIGSRHGQMLLMFLGLAVTYALRVNLSVGIVAMTDNSTNTNYPTMYWSSTEKGTILSAFFWGYMVMQIPAGILASRYGPSYLLAGSIFTCGVLTALTPLAAIYGGWVAVEVTRIIQGLLQGFIYPSVNTHLSKWIIPQERGRLFSFVFGGTQAGSIIMLMCGGVLADSAGGWPSIFYVSGLVAMLWGVVCAIYGADSPEKHKAISQKELHFIQSSLIHNSSDSNKMSTPWKEIFTSVPMIALILTHMGQNWGFWTLLTLMPTYISGVLKFNIKNNGFLSALPYIAMWLMAFVFSFISDIMNKKKIISLNVSRKLWNSVAHYGGALALVGLGFINDTAGAIALLTISVAMNSGTYVGFLTNHLDLSPNFAGTLMGITNCIANITSILAPQIAGIIVVDETSSLQWRTVFLISGGIFFIANTIFIVFGSTDVQSWNQPNDSKRKDSQIRKYSNKDGGGMRWKDDSKNY